MDKKLLTVGAIAEQLGVTVHRVVRFINTRGIKPVGRAGIARVFTEEDCARIGKGLKGK